MLWFVKEAAEYYLLFSGAILFLEAGDFSASWIPFAVSTSVKVLNFLLQRKLVRILVGKQVLNVNSIWRIGPSAEPQQPSPSQKVQNVFTHVPLPVIATLKWTIITGHVALFSAFVAYGN